ncbi:helix-turn-helix transcriptional regulator [Actinoplanes sp. LDG1-06]|uniref:Helix-turn-helix transcriptional regulator n=1 Tax=Paractinoplanes ovalisporus TaxID=2810368 RepID=A0ABS2AG18_9ACTN|nr:helix-turn-helix transcriptional regulator [Actinoplanes ovalisporus]MBM2618201.1 helix-turn-helix transcriptional regulator [Actinoplanes ovalisporus]
MSRSAKPDPIIGDRIRARRLMRGWSIRNAADRAGISHASWSRIERGLQAADNRFVLADIAVALECSIVELTGTPMPTADRRAAEAQAGVAALRQALVDIDPVTDARGTARPVAELDRDLTLLRDLRHDCEYDRAMALAPRLVGDLYAACDGPERGPALRMLCEATFLASSLLRALGHPGDAWVGAERCHELAAEIGDPALLGLAAFSRACAAINCGSRRRALTITEQAVSAADPGLEVTGVLHLVGAVAARDDAWAVEAARIAARTGETATHALFFGPANVNLWRIGTTIDAGDSARAVAMASTVDLSAAQVKSRLVFFHTDLARAYAGMRSREDEAVRHLLVAERVAPQHVHSSPLLQETTRALLDRARRRAGGTALRGLCERMRVGQ